MTDLRKAAEMALEALEDIFGKEKKDVGAINTLRQALALPEQEPLGGEWVPCVKLPVIVHVRNQRDGETHISTREGITPVLPEDLIMRGVAGEEYPIGRELFERTYTFDVDAVNMSQERFDETAKGEHEPFIYIRGDIEMPFGGYEHCGQHDAGAFPVYLAPPKREWVGLTDEDKDACWRADQMTGEEWDELFAAVEAKLKEKNG